MFDLHDVTNPEQERTGQGPAAGRQRIRRGRSRNCRRPEARQVYSWDITKLAGPLKGQYFDCYVMIDIYSG